MFKFLPTSRRLMNVYMGIALGIGAALLYLTFLMAYTHSHSGQMILVPMASNAQSCK